MTALTISCDDCIMRDTPACDGCVVTFICERDPGDAVVIDVEEERALRLLGRSGLVPPLRHCRRRPCDPDRADPRSDSRSDPAGWYVSRR